jgi:hypothetical protein
MNRTLRMRSALILDALTPLVLRSKAKSIVDGNPDASPIR